MQFRTFLILSIACVVSVALFLYDAEFIYDAPVHQAAQVIQTDEEAFQKSPRLVFVGDIMLGRFVEKLIADRGITYPFQNMRALISTPDLAIGNFEGVISEEHVPTPSGGFQFSIRNEYLTDILDLGFDILSLANNHSFDFGENALTYTRKICREIGLECKGSPRGIDEFSTSVETVHDTKVGFLFIQTVSTSFSDEILRSAINVLVRQSDVQVAVVHWGDEYVLVHNSFQKVLSEKLIDNGIDAVIAHHPHVVQDVALYKDKPIFYSLGNFIFDQYFSTEVQEGLVVTMEINKGDIVYSLIPVTNRGTQTQPDFMDSDDAYALLQRILADISGDSRVDIDLGTIAVKR